MRHQQIVSLPEGVCPSREGMLLLKNRRLALAHGREPCNVRKLDRTENMGSMGRSQRDVMTTLRSDFQRRNVVSRPASARAVSPEVSSRSGFRTLRDKKRWSKNPGNHHRYDHKLYQPSSRVGHHKDAMQLHESGISEDQGQRPNQPDSDSELHRAC